MGRTKNLVICFIWAIVFGGTLVFYFVNNENQQAKAVSDSVLVSQDVTSEISTTSPSDVTMSPSIPGMTGGTGTGSATWTIKSNDTSGFNMTVYADASPALVSGGNSFADYTTAGGANVPDYSWSVAAAAAEFGYSVEPATAADAVAMFKDNGTTTCNTGASQTADKCWLDFDTTPGDTIINRSSQTSSSGEAEVIKFTAESGASNFQVEGTYTTTVTITAVNN